MGRVVRMTFERSYDILSDWAKNLYEPPAQTPDGITSEKLGG